MFYIYNKKINIKSLIISESIEGKGYLVLERVLAAAFYVEQDPHTTNINVIFREASSFSR